MQGFDKKLKNRVLLVGDMVLLRDNKREKPGKHGKSDSLWLGPFQITAKAGRNGFHLIDLDGEEKQLRVNGQLLKHYFQ